MKIAAWLQSLGLERYEAAFREQDIDVEVLHDLTADDLTALGITSVGHRRKLLAAIAGLKIRVTASPKTPLRATPEPSAALGSSGDAERRQLTVMFCDLVDSTALSSRLDIEDLREVIAAYHNFVTDLVRQAEGMVAKYMGDGVLVYFGYPRAREDDAERALMTALDIVDAVGMMQNGEHGRLQCRVGIATGLVVVGDLIGTGAAQEQAVVGETPNLAARLQAVAEPGAVVIAQSTRDLVGDLFEYRDLGKSPLKGFTHDVPMWQVLRRGTIDSRFEALRSARLSRLVGREEEVELILRRWSQVRGGEGRIVLLEGEPGIGKSRITVAVYDALLGEPYVRLRYFCSPHRQDSALFPFAEQIKRQLYT